MEFKPYRNSSTHTGKIARLPKGIREELNRRLDQGESARSLVAWLNSTETVKTVLAPELGVWTGTVNEQNLSRWRHGGYQEWRRHQERVDVVSAMMERGMDVTAEVQGTDLGNHLSAVALADYAAALQEAQAEELKPKERCELLRTCLTTLAKVRREDYLARKMAMEWEAYEERKSREQAMEWGIRKYGSVERYHQVMKVQEQILREMEAEKLKALEPDKKEPAQTVEDQEA